MMRRSSQRATAAVTARAIPITSRRCHSSMPLRFDGRARVPPPGGRPPLLQWPRESRDLAAARGLLRRAEPLRPGGGSAAGGRRCLPLGDRDRRDRAGGDRARAALLAERRAPASRVLRAAPARLLAPLARARVRRARDDLLRRLRDRQ